MQIIQKIRDKGAAIVIGVIALSLIGFILMDANLGISRSAGSRNSSVGSVNGNAIDVNELDEKYKGLEAQYAQYYGGRLPSGQTNMLRQTAWDQVVMQKVAESEFAKLGLQFTSKELNNILFSENAPAALKQAFTDENGKYDLQKVSQWFSESKKAKDEKRAVLESQVVDPTVFQSLYTKYSGLLAASAYYPTWMKDKDAADLSSFANVSYVAIPYGVVNDSTIKVSDTEINDYVAKHNMMYKQEGGRQIAYATFSANPSSKDTADAFNSLLNLKSSFASDTNASSFVSRNMSTKKFEDLFIPKSKLPAAQKDVIAGLAKDSVYGPYLEGGEFAVVKMLGSKVLPDSIKCRHILIGTKDRQSGEQIMSDSIAKIKIDSVEMAIRGGASFDELEAKLSTDQAAHKDKGVMTFDIATIQNKNQFAVEFGDFLLNEKGETRKTVKTNFGWHYIEILEKKNPAPAYKVAFLAKDVVPSDETLNSASAKASKLSGEARTLKAFDEYTSKNGIQKMDGGMTVKESDYSMGSLQDAKQLIQWAFGAKMGEVSEPFNMGDQYLVGVVTKIVPEGLPDAATARPQVEMYVRNNKKAETIKSKLTATPTLESAAAAYNLQVATAGADSSILFSNPVINGIGSEPKLVGAIFNKTYQTKVSEPIAGTNGVYVVKVNSVGAKNPQSPEEVEKNAVNKAKGIASQLGNGWYEGLKKTSVIKDERNKKD